MGNLPMIERCEKIYQRHQLEMVIGRKTERELIACVKAFLDLQAIDPLELFPQRIMKERDKMYWLHFDSTEEFKGKIPEFKAYLITRNEKSEKYYQGNCIFDDTVLYILIEVNSCYFETNSNLLSAKLTLLRGLKQKDLDERTLEFALYIMSSFPEDDDNPINDDNKENETRRRRNPRKLP